MRLPHRRRFLHLAATVAALPSLSQIARAQTYPTRPVRFIVPLAAGGGLDFAARLIGEYLTRAFGQQVIIENKVGAGGMLAIETVAKSPPDGYTVLITTDVVSSGPYVVQFNTDYVKNLMPLIELARNPVVLAIHPSLGVSSIAELISTAKMRPGLGFASSGVGTQQHFVGEWFAKITGIKLDHIPLYVANCLANKHIAEQRGER
jgi:tripartite-type tricarboxylate transporter receptor subunit TctC